MLHSTAASLLSQLESVKKNSKSTNFVDVTHQEEFQENGSQLEQQNKNADLIHLRTHNEQWDAAENARPKP